MDIKQAQRVGGVDALVAFVPGCISLFLLIASWYIRRQYDLAINPQLILVPLGFLAVPFIRVVGFHRDHVLRSERPGPGFFFGVGMVLVLGAALGLRLAGMSWGGDVLSPVYEMQFRSNNAHIDTLYHTAIANMIRQYGVPSIGVNDLEPIRYHVASHYLMAWLGKIFGVSTIASYHLIYPVFVPPLFVAAFLSLSREASRLLFGTTRSGAGILALGLLFVGLAGLLPDPVRSLGETGNFVIASESHAVGLTVAMGFGALLLWIRRTGTEKWYRLLIPTVAAIATAVLVASKISVGALWVAGIGFLWISRPRARYLFLTAVSSALVFLVVFPAFYGGSGGSTEVVLFHFLRRMNRTMWSWSLLIHVGWSLGALLLVRTTNALGDALRRSLTVVITGVSITGLIPGLVFDIVGGSALYFISVNTWLSLPLLSPLIAESVRRLLPAARKTRLMRQDGPTRFVLAVVLLSVLGTPLLNTGAGLFALRRSLSSYEEIDPGSAALWDRLSELEDSGGRPVTATFRNFSPVEREGREPSPRGVIRPSLAVPAVAGVPITVDVTKWLEPYEKPFHYGFDRFIDTETEFTSMNKGIESVIIEWNIES